MFRYYILAFILVSCQKKTHSDDLKKVDYVNYSLTIKEAERNIINENYQNALQNYINAFQYTDKPLANHCYTAMQVSAILNDSKHFKFFASKALSRGLLPSYFKTDSLINDFMIRKKITSFINSKFKTEHLHYQKSIDSFLLDTIKELSNLDNKLKIYYLDSLANKDPSNKKKYYEIYDSIIGSIVEKHLFPIIKKYGYPGERKIGFEEVGFENSYNFAFTNNRAKLILLHYFSFPRHCDYNNLLLEEVYNGNLLPEHYASFIDFQAKFGNDEYCNVDYYNEWHSTDDKTLFNSINKRRINIGLEPFQELTKKFKRGQDICEEIKKGKFKNIKLFYWCG